MKTWHGYLGLGIVFAGILLAAACNAQVCGEFDDIADTLAKEYDEHPVKVGRVPQLPAFIVMFESAHGAASFVTVSPTGACFVQGVGHWQAWPVRPPWRDL